jgi:MFS family permease
VTAVPARPVSFVIFLVGYLGFAVTQNVVLIAGLFAFYGLFQGIFRAAGKAFAADFVPEHLWASSVGWYSTTIGVLQLASSLVVGMLWDRVSHVAVFYYGAAFVLVGIIGLLSVIPARHDPRSTAEAK